MAWINIEHYMIAPAWSYADANGVVQYNDLLQNINDTTKTFIFNTCNRRSALGSASGANASVDADDLSALPKITSATDLEVTILQAGMSKSSQRPFMFETWEYIGPSGGDNEFKVIGQYHVELDQVESVDTTINGVTNAADCVCFINGILHTNGTDAADGLTAIAYLTSSTNLKVKRGAGANDKTVVSVTIVEFTGSNWTIRQAQAQSGDDSGTITLPTSVSDWDNAFIYHQFKANSANHVDDAIADTSAVYYQDDSVMNEVYWLFHSDHVDSVGDSIHYVYVVENPDITVYRESSTNNTNAYLEFFTSLNPRPAAYETSMMVSRSSSGTGAAYPRGFDGAVYTGKYAHTWCMYSGNTADKRVQLIHFGTDSWNPTDNTYIGAVIKNTDVNSYWPLQGNYLDYGSAEWANNYTDFPVVSFVTKGDDDTAFGCRGHTKSLKLSAGTGTSMSAEQKYMVMCNSPCSNWGGQAERTLGGWFSLSKIQELSACIYKEGGGANNIAFLVGFGNTLMVQVDQTTGGTEYVQVYGDFPLSAQRPYHVTLVFKGNDNVKLYIDGKLQERSFNNPYDFAEHPSHTGPQIWGIDSSIDAGGPNVEFFGPEAVYLASWFNANTVLPENDIRFYLVEHGLPTLENIPSGTAANMQSALDNLADTSLDDYPLGIRINAPTDGNDLTLTADNVTVNENMTYHIQWLGTGKLTWKNSNGSNISVYSTLFGGTVEIINSKTVNVHVYDIRTGNAIAGAAVYFVELDRYETTDSSGDISFTEFLQDGADMTVRIRKATTAPYYKPYKIQLTIPSGDIEIVAPLIPDN